MPKARFTVEEIKDIQREKTEGSNDKELALRWNCSTNTIWRMLHKKPKRVAPTSDTPDKIAKMGCHKKGKQGGEVATGSGLKQQLSRMVADAVDQRLAGLGLDTLDAKIEDALTRLLK